MSHRQRPQHLMEAAAKHGHQVTFVNNIGLRFPRLRDARRVRRRLAQWLGVSRSSGQPISPPGVKVKTPFILPFQQFRIVRWLGRRSLTRILRAHMQPLSVPLIIWTYLPLPIIRDVASDLSADLLVYDWADDLSEHMVTATRSHRERVRRWEDEMAATADVVIAASEELCSRRKPPVDRTHLIGHGAVVNRADQQVPEELEDIDQPRVGVVGSISDSVDVDLLWWLAEQRPSWSFVLVGPVKTDVAHLRSQRNVHLLGERPHHRVSAFLHNFDAALVPYRITPATLRASSVRLREYLAHGLPVVSVDIPDARTYADHVWIGGNRDSFLEGLDQALKSKVSRTPPPVPRWDQQAEAILALLESRLDRPPSTP